MTLFAKPLLFLATASLFSAFVMVAPRAESARAIAAPSEVPAPPAQDAIIVAQGLNRPPGEIGEGAGSPYFVEQDAPQPDPGSLLVRIGRLESQMRQLNGQIEQMQFETRRLQEQLRKFQEDVDFRFREHAPSAPAASPPQKRSEASESQISADNQSRAQSAPVGPPQGNRRSDAFDPAQNPDAPGAPRPLGSLAAATASSAPGRTGQNIPPVPDQDDPGAPLDLAGGLARAAPAPATRPTAPAASAGGASSGTTTPGGTVIAALPNSPRQEFDIALAYFKQRAYENAEKGFSKFIEKNPKDRLASDATYYLGESFYLRGRHREAAEQFLKIPEHYPASPRAPQALLRLGQSLNALGAKEQACATFGEITRKYPNAPAMIKAVAERETKRAQC